MVRRKKIICTIIILLFMTIILSPGISSNNYINQDQILTIWMPGISNDDYFTQLEVSEEQLQIFNDKINITFNIINNTKSPDSTGKSIITYEDWQNISENVNTLISSIKSIIDDFPNIDTEVLVSNVIEAFFRPPGGYLRPKPFFSIGIGFTWIPFYGFETFLGLMLRPILTSYIFGFSHVGGLTRTDLTIGQHLMVNICFCGLFINLGDIGSEKIIGPSLYVGTVFFYKI